MNCIPTEGLRRERLPNGVTLLVQRRRAAPAVSLVTHMRAGFLDEPDTVVGISHVLEHMLFKGTPSLGPGELAQRTKALGGTLNAYTAYDRTVYYASAPARHVAALIALQADQVQHSAIDADELYRELRVISQEARRKLDSPGSVAGETLHELLFRTHRMRRWRIGLEAELEQFTRDDVASYYHSRYVPSRAIVALVGDVDEVAALAALRREWGGWVGAAAEIPLGPGETTPPPPAARRLTGDVTRSDLVLGWRGPGVLDADIPALEMVAAIVAVGRGSRLVRSLRDTGLVNSIGAGVYGVVDAGVFSIGVELDAVNIAPALRVIGDTLRDLSRHAVDPSEFARAATMLRAGIGRRLERYESRATAFADAESFGDVTRVDREVADLAAVTPDTVRDMVARWLPVDEFAAVAYLPRDSDVPFDTDVLRHSIRETSVDSANATRPLPSSMPDESATARTRESTPAITIKVARATIHHLALPAADVLAARFGDTGQTSLHVYRLRQQLENTASAGLSSLSARIMARGAGARDANELAFAFESMGGSLGAGVGADMIGFGATVLQQHTAAAMELLLDVLCRPRFDPAVLATERALLIDDARAVADDMVRFPMLLALGMAFDDVDYGAPSLGTPASLASFTPADIADWHAAMLRGGRTTIIAVGDADPARLVDQVADAWARRGPASDAEPTLGAAPAEIRTIHPGVRREVRDRQQSALAMLFPGPSRGDPDRFAADVWSAVAGGLGGRLFESLRSARSLAYTVIANAWQRRRAGGLLTYIACDPARLDEARDAMLAELAQFTQQPPAAAELARAIAELAGDAEMSPQTAGTLAAQIADAWLLGQGLSELDDPAAHYRDITGDQVLHLAQSSLDPGRRAEGVVAVPPR